MEMEIARDRFAIHLRHRGLATLRRTGTRILQINLGKLCNQTCTHCHVGAGPGRREVMTAETADRIIVWMSRHRPETVDITGGAPELCPEFRCLASAARRTGSHVIVRCNLTVIFEPGQEDLPGFYADEGVELVCSLPCYSAGNVDLQRGEGVFEKSIRALGRFNELGYGTGKGLVLTLVYNPVGASLPPDQAGLEEAYRIRLRDQYGIEFDRLYCLTNLPVTRFHLWLEQSGQLEEYQQLLLDHFDPANLDGLMCRDTINVGWRGDLFDCDFNQMVDLPMGGRPRSYLWDLDPNELDGARIATGSHCFGCTAGLGSSCGGTVT